MFALLYTKEWKTCIQRLETEMRALQEQHQREMDDCAKETQRKCECEEAHTSASSDLGKLDCVVHQWTAKLMCNAFCSFIIFWNLTFLVKVKSKDVEVKEALERKENAFEDMKRKMKDQEKQRQSEIIKLQMEVHPQ